MICLPGKARCQAGPVEDVVLLVISMCLYEYRVRPDVGRGPMTTWYAIVFVINPCDSMVLCLYGYRVMCVSGGARCRARPDD